MFNFHNLIFGLLIYAHLAAFARGLFEECSEDVHLQAGERLRIKSPLYPQPFPAGSSCRYMVRAPRDYQLSFKCDIDIKLPPSAVTSVTPSNPPLSSARCYDEIFYFNREGSELLSGSEYFCGIGSMERKSFLNQAVISYISMRMPQWPAIGSSTRLGGGQGGGVVAMMAAFGGAAGGSGGAGAVIQKHHYILNKQSNKNNMSFNPLTQNKHTSHAMSASSSTTPPQAPATATLITASSASSAATTANQFNTFTHFIDLLSNSIESSVFIAPPPPTRKPHVKKTKRKNEKEKTTKSTQKVFRTTTTTAMPTTTTTTTTESINFLSSFALSLLALSARNGSDADADPVTALPELNTNSMRSAAELADQADDQPADQVDQVKQSQSRILSGQPTSYAAEYTSETSSSSVAGNGRFSCLVEAIPADCDCGWSPYTLKVVSPSGVAGVNEYVSMAGVLTLQYRKIFCGAVIIHHRFLLSAAHCFMSAATNRSALIQVVVGEHDLSTAHESIYTNYYNIDAIILHERFHATASQVRNDIALLRTRQAIAWNRGVAPACLPFRSAISGAATEDKPPIAGQQVETAGWGSISFGGPQSSLLLRAQLDVIGAEECRAALGAAPPSTFCTFTPGRDTCQYDSGGGLYMRQRNRLFVVGIVSYGYGCAARQPSVNTKVASHLKWIRSNTPLATYCVK